MLFLYTIDAYPPPFTLFLFDRMLILHHSRFSSSIDAYPPPFKPFLFDWRLSSTIHAFLLRLVLILRHSRLSSMMALILHHSCFSSINDTYLLSFTLFLYDWNLSSVIYAFPLIGANPPPFMLLLYYWRLSSVIHAFTLWLSLLLCHSHLSPSIHAAPPQSAHILHHFSLLFSTIRAYPPLLALILHYSLLFSNIYAFSPPSGLILHYLPLSFLPFALILYLGCLLILAICACPRPFVLILPLILLPAALSVLMFLCSYVVALCISWRLWKELFMRKMSFLKST